MIIILQNFIIFFIKRATGGLFNGYGIVYEE